jgi:hypothetical protein
MIMAGLFAAALACYGVVLSGWLPAAGRFGCC